MRARILSVVAVAALVAALPSVAAAQPGAPRMFTDPEAPGHGGFTVAPPTAPLLMAFHTCVSDCSTPRNHMIRLAQSADGASWTEVAGWQPYSGSVPDVFRRGDTVYVVGTGMSKIDLRTGRVTAHRISTKRADGSNAMPRDVSFAGQLDDGRLVIVYVPPMSEISPGASQYRVHLAVEKAGSFDIDKVVAASPGIELDTAPEGYVKVHENHHLWSKTRIGEVQKDGQFKVVFESDLIEPNPFPEGYQ